LSERLLSFEHITKRFGGTTALRDVSLHLDAGEVLALLGENGAGKSTLIKSLAGIHTPDEGRILFKGDAYAHRPPRPNEKQRVAFIHQDLGLVEWMTVAENVGLGQGFSKRGGLISWRDTERRAVQALKMVGCDFDPTKRVHDLSRTEKSLVAIARALAAEADVLVLDEPTGMIYVSHRLDEIFRIADRVAVLRDGRMVGATAVKDTTPSELVNLIVGREVKDLYVRATRKRGFETLKVSNLVTFGAGPVSFSAHEGEVLGLVGLRGAGQEAIGRALFGAQQAVGTVHLGGKLLDLSSPQVALAQGMGLVARDRTEESVALSLSVRENMFLNPLAIGRTLMSVLSPSAEAESSRGIGAEVGLRPNDPSLQVEALSGGNQQKVVIGRWLATGRKVLIAEDPTSGVDVGAKAEIYRLFVKALEQGLTVIVVSTDFEEVAHICHRALVFSRGSIVAEISQENLSTAALIHAASANEAA
jgi:ribose transport system ATP-binding protein